MFGPRSKEKKRWKQRESWTKSPRLSAFWNHNLMKILIRVPMRHNGADLDRITDVLLTYLAGESLRLAEIERIEPNMVSAFAGNVTFLISGRNLWRGAEAYLLGQKGTDIKVLPDMEGIAVPSISQRFRKVRRLKIQS